MCKVCGKVLPLAIWDQTSACAEDQWTNSAAEYPQALFVARTRPFPDNVENAAKEPYRGSHRPSTTRCSPSSRKSVSTRTSMCAETLSHARTGGYLQDHQGDGGRGVQRRLRNLIKLVALSVSFRQTGARVRKVLDAVRDRKSEATSMASRKAVANEFDLNFTGDFDGCWADCL